jgi:hypothetical protein
MTKADITYDKLKEILTRKKYNFFTGDMNLNMIGIRSSNRKVDNWDDFFCIAYTENDKKMLWVNDMFTTDPGIYYMTQKLLNPAGCGILAEGQYPGMWTFGKHGVNKYDAFVQVGECKAYRDRNRDNIMDFDPKSIQKGYFGCNQHHGYDSTRVNNNSAMCQVHKFKKDLAYSLSLAKKSSNLYGNKFTYTLLNESDFK